MSEGWGVGSRRPISRRGSQQLNITLLNHENYRPLKDQVTQYGDLPLAREYFCMLCLSDSNNKFSRPHPWKGCCAASRVECITQSKRHSSSGTNGMTVLYYKKTFFYYRMYIFLQYVQHSNRFMIKLPFTMQKFQHNYESETTELPEIATHPCNSCRYHCNANDKHSVWKWLLYILLGYLLRF